MKAEERDNSIAGIRFLLVRQYAPGSMRTEVDDIIKTLDTDDLKVTVIDLSQADEVHLDEMTLTVSRSDGEPFEDNEKLTLMLEDWMNALIMYTPVVTPITYKEMRSGAGESLLIDAEHDAD